MSALVVPANTTPWCACGMHGHIGHRDYTCVGLHSIVELERDQMANMVARLTGWLV